MRSECMHILDVFKNYPHLSIPVFQRSYSWGNTEVITLLRDLISYGRDQSSSSMFVGTIIISRTEDIEQNKVISSVIDGQQRLITMTLIAHMLLSLKKYGDDEFKTLIPNVVNYMDVNVHNKDKLSFNVIKNSGYNYSSVVSDGSNVLNNFVCIMRFINNLSHSDVKDLLDGMHKSMVSVIDLEMNDDIQGVLSSLNSTGKQLSDFDLIKNASLAKFNSTTQEELYNNSWKLICDDSAVNGISENDIIKRILANYNMTNVYDPNDRLDLFKTYTRACKQYMSQNLGRSLPIEAMIRRYYRLIEISNSINFDKEVEDICERLRLHSGQITESAIISLKLASVNRLFKNSDSLLKILKYLDSFIVRAKLAKLSDNYIKQQIGNAFKKLHLGSLAIGDEDMEIDDSIENTYVFSQLGYNDSSEEAGDGSVDETQAVANFGYVLFCEDTILSESLQSLKTGLLETKMEDDSLCTAILAAQDDIHIRAAKRSYEGTTVERFKIPDTRTWRTWFSQNVTGIEFDEFNERYGGTVVCSILLPPNQDLSFEDYNMTNSEDEGMFKLPGIFMQDLKAIAKTKDTQYRSLKTWNSFFSKGFSLDDIIKYEETLLKDCEKIWPFPQFNKVTRTRNQGEWIRFIDVQYEAGAKAKSFRMDDVEMKKNIVKECTKTWKTTLYVVIKLAASYQGGAFTQLPEWGDLIYSDEFKVDKKVKGKGKDVPSNILNTKQSVLTAADKLAELAKNVIRDAYESEPSVNARIQKYEGVIRAKYLTATSPAEIEEVAEEMGSEVKQSFMCAYMELGNYYVKLPKNNKLATELVTSAMKHIGFKNLYLKL